MTGASSLNCFLVFIEEGTSESLWKSRRLSNIFLLILLCRFDV